MSRTTQDSVFESGSREERLLVTLSVPSDCVDKDRALELLGEHINWPYVMMGAMQHRTLSMLWENIKTLGLMPASLKSGLTKNWIFYADTLARASVERNRLWLDLVEGICSEFERRGIPLVVIKGGALIGDIYHVGNRMLGDVDSVAPRKDADEIIRVLIDLGFIQGQIDPVTSTIVEPSRSDKRFWSLYSHALPKFTYPTGDDRYPFLRFAVGFDFYDPTDEYEYPSEFTSKNRILRAGSNMWVPDDVDTIICLSAHIFREGVSAVFAYAGENWHLWKFCDMRQILAKPHRPGLREALVARLKEHGLLIPFYFAVHHTYNVYGDEFLLDWLSLVDVGDDRGFLTELIDGDKRYSDSRPFVARLFDTSRLSLGDDKPVWAKVMANGEWW